MVKLSELISEITKGLDMKLTDEEWTKRDREIDELRKKERRQRIRTTLSQLRNRGYTAKEFETIMDGGIRETSVTRAIEAGIKSNGIVIFSGNNGSGKTFAAHLLVCRRIEMLEFPDSKHYDLVRAGRLVGVAMGGDRMNELVSVGTLVIDDLGEERLRDGDYFNQLLSSIIAERHASGRFTIITTNLGRAEFSSRYGDRVVDRIRDGEWIKVAGKSMRGRK